MNISAQIRHWSTVRGLTATGLSKASGVNRESIIGYFGGSISPTPRSIERICKALNVTQEEFLGWKKAAVSPVDEEKARNERRIRRVLKIIGEDYLDNPIEFHLADKARRISGRGAGEECFGGATTHD